MNISFCFHRYLKNDLENLLRKREVISIDFNEALALGDAVENFPLDEARQAREVNENKIRDIEKALQYPPHSHDSVEDQILVGTVFKAKSAKTGEEILMILSGPEFANLLPTGYKIISISTELGQAALNKRVGEGFSLASNQSAQFIVVSIEKY